MPSSGIGSDITLQEAVDLLHKLTTEFTKVVASLGVSPGLRASVFGKVKIAKQDDTFWVMGDNFPVPSTISFDPRLAVRRTYGDSRAIPSLPEGAPEKWPRFSSALCFEFPNGTRLCLFASEEF
jgi:hypothetical protein